MCFRWLEAASGTVCHPSSHQLQRSLFFRLKTYLGFVILQFWATHEDHLTGCIFPQYGATIGSDMTETMLLHVVGDVAGKFQFAPRLGQFWGILGEEVFRC